MGLIGSLIGAAAGGVIQYYLPAVFSEFLPFDVQVFLSWKSILQGIATGVTAAMLFALFPLIQIRNVSPLKALRASFENTVKERWHFWYTCLLLFLL